MPESCIMRVNLIAQSSGPFLAGIANIPLNLTIRPACGLPGSFLCPTDSATLLRMLHQKTDLPSSVLKRFEGDLRVSPSVRLLGVGLSERVLTDIGYFVD